MPFVSVTHFAVGMYCSFDATTIERYRNIGLESDAVKHLAL